MQKDGPKEQGRNFSKIVRTADTTFYAPLKWKESKRIFVESLGDFFHEDVDPADRLQAWKVMGETPRTPTSS